MQALSVSVRIPLAGLRCDDGECALGNLAGLLSQRQALGQAHHAVGCEEAIQAQLGASLTAGLAPSLASQGLEVARGALWAARLAGAGLVGPLRQSGWGEGTGQVG